MTETGIATGGLAVGAGYSLTVTSPKRARATNMIGGGRGGMSIGGDPYDAASFGTQELSAWHPRLASADAEVLPSRDRIVARSRALDRNNGWARGGVDKRVDAVVGAKTWLKAKPDFAAMGMSAQWADEWSLRTEALFRVWANSPRFLCDVERHHHFGGLVRLAYTHYVIDGEAAAPLYFLDRGGMFSTAVLVMDPDRLGNPDGKPDSEFLRGGVALDRHGAAKGYWARRAHESDLVTNWNGARWRYIPRETPTGRPLFVHVFDKRRAHMRRGLGRFTSIMSRMKMLDRYDATEIQAAVTNAIFGLYAKTTRDADGVRDSLAPAGDEYDDSAALDEARLDFYEKSELVFDGVKIAVLPADDTIETIDGKRPATNFKAFQRAVLNSIAAGLGLSGEQLSNDWEGINYSSARTLLNEIWRGLNSDRHLFTQAFCTPIYAAWLEEAVARDLIDVPGGKAMFYVFRDALCQCDWIGPPRGWIDPKKEAEAAAQRIGLGLSSPFDEAAEQGNDFRVNLWDQKRAQEARAQYGLAQHVAGTGDAGGGNDDDDPDRGDRAERAAAAGRAE